MGELEKEKASLIASMNSEAAAAVLPSPVSGAGPEKSKASSASVEALRERLKVANFFLPISLCFSRLLFFFLRLSGAYRGNI